MWLLITLCSLASVSVVQAVDELEEVNSNIFNLMYDYGMNNKNNSRVNQYLVVTLLTDAEYRKSAKWNSLKQLEEQDRVKLYLNNRKKTELEELGEKASRHGEVIFLYSDRSAIDDLHKKLPPQTSDELPVLIMYSFYIPCACIKGCNFSCSEELGIAALFFRSQYRFVVAFKEIFEINERDIRTNEDAAITFMREGGIQVYRRVRDQLYELVQHDSGQLGSVSNRVFQNVLLRLLLDNPVSVCTRDYPRDNKNESSRVIAAFLNSATKDCFDDQCSKYWGRISDLRRVCLRRCLNTYIKTNIGTDCKLLPNKSEQHLWQALNNSVNDALLQSDRVGYPTIGGYNNFIAVPDDVRWNALWDKRQHIYNRLLDSYTRTTPECPNPHYTVESMCTKEKDRTENVGRSFSRRRLKLDNRGKRKPK